MDSALQYRQLIAVPHVPKLNLLRSLLEHGINVDNFLKSSPGAQLQIIINAFNLPTYSYPQEFEQNSGIENPNQGLIVIKPEALSVAQEVKGYLHDLGIEVISISPFIYAPDQYWSMYGDGFLKYFNEFPYGAALFLINISSPSVLVRFEHKSIPEYIEIYKSISGATPRSDQQLSFDDPQTLFDVLFIRTGPAAIRQKIIQPEITRLHLDDMAIADPEMRSYWNFTGHFAKRKPNENIRTFNGVHCARNSAELMSNQRLFQYT